MNQGSICTGCGRVTSFNQLSQPSEEILTEVKAAKEIGFGKGEQYDLYLTSSRLVAIKMAARPMGGAAFGVAGILAERAIKNHLASKKRENLEGLSLDQMLASDKKNLAIEYDSVRSFKVVSSMMQKIIEVQYGNNEKKKYAVNKETIQQLETKLPSVKSLEGKLALPN